MKALFQRFDGSCTIQDMKWVPENTQLVLVPRRDGLTWEIIDYMRYDITDQKVDGIPVFVQTELPITTQDTWPAVSDMVKPGTGPIKIVKRTDGVAKYVRNAQ